MFGHIYKEASYPNEEPDSFVLSLYQQMPKEDLIKKINFYDTKASYLILRALTKNNFELISAAIKENLSNNFESLRTQSSQKLVEKYGNEGLELVESAKSVDDFRKEGFVSVSLAILATNGNKSDIQFARKYI